ncbi:MAG: hypothetical protein JST68_15380 [Bacteroidetes bacterium]|nr:hypothetical protein [Bacteroidota bacterium]
MQSSTSTCRTAQNIGEYISHDYYLSLVNGYNQQHPTEQKSVFISKQSILETLDQFPNVSGIRFMYGQKEGAAPTSRTVVLMPCNDTSTDRPVPNLILTPLGYLTDTKERLSLNQCWDLFDRYVNRM